MYPQLTAPLLVGVATSILCLAWVAVRRPFLRRLAGRQLRRRRTEGVLVVAGSLLGTTMIVASLVVGDTLDRSVRNVAHRTLGNVDERVVSHDPAIGAEVSRRLSALSSDPRVDGVLDAATTEAGALRRVFAGDIAEPRTYVWEIDFAKASAFGQRDAGLSGSTPEPGQAVVNSALAKDLKLRVGDTFTVFPFAVPTDVRVVRVVPATGLAGLGPGDRNRDAFLALGSLARAAAAARNGVPTSLTFVSNRGGVESGSSLTDAVTARINKLLDGTPAGASVETPKQRVLKEAEQTGNVLGGVFLFVSSFSIIAGVLLLVNVFVMLAEERKSEIGMMRAVGLRRARLVGALTIEGSLYAAISAVIGIGLGIGVGRGVVVAAERVFRSFGGGAGLSDMTFSVRPTSLINGAAAGFLIAFVTVAAASARISRTNVIAAIRDLPSGGVRQMRRRNLALCALGALAFGGLSVREVASSSGPLTYAAPALAIVCAAPLLARRLPRRLVSSGAALLVLGWALVANLVRPHVFDNPTSATYIVLGSMLAFSAVVLISDNQHIVLRPFRRLIDRPSEGGLAARLAVAYPTAKRFRSGATLAMYSLVIFTLVLLTQINGIVMAGIDSVARDANGRYAVRVDFAVPPQAGVAAAIRATSVGNLVASSTPLRTVTATSDDPGGRWTSPLPVITIGVTNALAADALPLDERLPQFASDSAVWRAVAADDSLVIVDSTFGATGGPIGKSFGPGATLTVTDPRTGSARPRTVAALMNSAWAFYGMTANYTYPVLLSDGAIRDQFGSAAAESTALVALHSRTNAHDFSAQLQAALLSSGVVATDLDDSVRQNFVASQNFFRLMQGFLALGLVVGICGLGVVMVRAVRERRRTIGVLRALGFRARTIRRAFLVESSLLAAEGILSGALLSVVTSYMLYTNSAAFGTLSGPFPVAWLQIALIVGVTFVVSIAATLPPANRAAAIRPALAVRVSD